MDNINIIIRKATKDDDLVRISELIYGVDPYIYSYWFESEDNCRKVLSKLLLEKEFIFYIDTFYLAIDKNTNKIIGVSSLVDQYTDLDYDYVKFFNTNDRYKYIYDNYIIDMLKAVKEKNTACVTNMCIDKDYRNRHIGYKLLGTLISDYVKRENYSKVIEFDVLKNNPSAINLYKHLGFEQISDTLKGFNGPNMEKPDVIIMRLNIEEKEDLFIL